MKKLISFICICLSSSVFAQHDNISPFNMAYVEVNDNNLANAGCYVRSDNGKPFFHMASIFAANIHGDDPNQPNIYFNSQVDTLLNHTDQVARLHNQGIKVLLTLLGDHQNAGWSCMTNANAIQKFANHIVTVINQYKLDGVDIDDEYSKCTANTTSMVRIAQALKNHPGFKGKILSKALYKDADYFTASYKGKKLADYLDYGWEMRYNSPNFAQRLSPYVGFNMPLQNLALGASTQSADPTANSIASFILQNMYGGVMVYNVKNDSQDYLTQLAQVEYRVNINVLSNCLDK
ncbi:MAG: glycosyl hydrolase family 18 protein [Gammaproteobacteria bacterium]